MALPRKQIAGEELAACILSLCVCVCVQTIAFVHGHQHSWHSLDMLENLRALRWDLVTQHRDLNRIMPVWTHKVGSLNATPEAVAVAELPDSYNGSYNVNQVRGSLSCLWAVDCLSADAVRACLKWWPLTS